jgi:hypothetical protein
MVEKICAQNKAGRKVIVPSENLFTLKKSLVFKQQNTTTTTEFSSQVNGMYTSVIHQNGRYAFDTGYYDLVLERHSIGVKDNISLNKENHERYNKGKIKYNI